MRDLSRSLVLLGRFWWDFVVGDTPEITAGVLVLVALTLLLRHDQMVAAIAIPVLGALLLSVSTWRGRQPRVRRKESQGSAN